MSVLNSKEGCYWCCSKYCSSFLKTLVSAAIIVDHEGFPLLIVDCWLMTVVVLLHLLFQVRSNSCFFNLDTVSFTSSYPFIINNNINRLSINISWHIPHQKYCKHCNLPFKTKTKWQLLKQRKLWMLPLQLVVFFVHLLNGYTYLPLKIMKTCCWCRWFYHSTAVIPMFGPSSPSDALQLDLKQQGNLKQVNIPQLDLKQFKNIIVIKSPHGVKLVIPQHILL